MSRAEPILELHGVSRAFGGIAAVDGVDLRIRAGERHAVIGPNGAGKTTLFHLITGLLHPDRGEIRLRGRRIDRLSPPEICRAGVGRTFQITSVFRQLSVGANVQVALFAREEVSRRLAVRSRGMERDRVRALLEEVGLGDKEEAACSVLSYGDQRRLELALTLALAPEVLVLDEPAAGLGEGERRQLMELIRRLTTTRPLTLLFTDHDMDVVFGLAERVTVLHQGRVLAEGSPDEVRRSPRVSEVYLG